MYGYVKPDVGALTEEEAALYRALACGLCRAMRRETGLASALALRYDMIFLALCRTLAEGRPLTFRNRRCPLHPLRKRRMAEECEALVYTAGAAAVLHHLKVRDDLADRRGLSRLSPLLRLPRARRAARRAALPALRAALSAPSRALALCEREGDPSCDRAAEESGRMLAAAFASTYRGDYASVLAEVGYRLGRLVYLLDALDDFYEDKRRGGYNPYLLLYGEDTATLCEDAEAGLHLELSALAEAVSRLPEDEDGVAAGILKNILYYGLPAALHAVLEGLRKGGAG